MCSTRALTLARLGLAKAKRSDEKMLQQYDMQRRASNAYTKPDGAWLNTFSWISVGSMPGARVGLHLGLNSGARNGATARRNL